MGAATKEARKTKIKAFELNGQEKTEPDLLFSSSSKLLSTVQQLARRWS
jgi:hypothetical protein